jgi:hypothetical protein
LETDYERQQRLAREEVIKEHEEKYYRELTKVTKEQLKLSDDRLLFKIDLCLKELDQGFGHISVTEQPQVFRMFKECLSFIYAHPLKLFHQALLGAQVQENRLARKKR